MTDVARASGFSTSTVSLVLNDAPLGRHLSAKTKEHIRKTALAMGYRPDAFARSLRRRRSHTIGIMVFDLSDPFCTLILRGIQKTLYPTTYLPIIMDAQNERKQFERYLEMLLEHRVEGLIVVANWLFGESDLLTQFEKNNIPMVGVGRDLTASGIRSVQVDNESGGYVAAEHLHSLGHRAIAVIRGPKELADSERRWEGIQRYAQNANLKIDPARIVQMPAAVDPTSGFDGGYRLTAELIESEVEFTSIIAFDDLTALGAMRALRQAGRRVPDDCSIVGFDDVPIASLSSPGITTIRQPMEEMGSLVAAWILESINPPAQINDLSARLELLTPSLVVRESTTRRP
jgi:LacI family transcriptional regulator